MTKISKNKFIIIDEDSVFVRTTRTRDLTDAENERVRRNVEANRAKSVQRPAKKDPTDALGACMSGIDVGMVDGGIDFCSIKKFIDVRTAGREDDECAILDDSIWNDICILYDMTLKELLETFMDRYSEKFTLEFVKNRVRPFIAGLRNDKFGWESGVPGSRYRPIYDLL